MNLLLDIGNSRIKWSLAAVRNGAAAGDIELLGQASAADGFSCLDCIDQAPARVLVSNVAGPAIAGLLRAYCEARWALAPEFAAAEPSRGALRNGYENYRLLGVDRWLALLAAWHTHHGAVCVVDVGTALTVDLIDAHGQHLGGFIAPGAELMVAALNAGTGDIERFRDAGSNNNPDPGHVAPGRNTREAIDSGAWLAMAGLVERARALLPGDAVGARFIVTGGNGDRLLPLLEARAEHCPALVLRGLWLYWQDAGGA
ncbi:MAG: type III pantothenate kinase [Gammaproteobacteria bacterium]|nr:type III pantothenate kinase [Gammaproteobacteria bacterium]